MPKNPSSCSGPGEKCPPKALTDKIIVNSEESNNSLNLGDSSQQYLGIKPKPKMSKKMNMAQQIRNARGGKFN